MFLLLYFGLFFPHRRSQQGSKKTWCLFYVLHLIMSVIQCEFNLKKKVTHSFTWNSFFTTKKGYNCNADSIIFKGRFIKWHKMLNQWQSSENWQRAYVKYSAVYRFFIFYFPGLNVFSSTDLISHWSFSLVKVTHLTSSNSIVIHVGDMNDVMSEYWRTGNISLPPKISKSKWLN